MFLPQGVKVELQFNNQERCNLLGLYTINQQRLASLEADTLLSLNCGGFLQGAFLVAASARNVQYLIELKHRQRQTAAAS